MPTKAKPDLDSTLGRHIELQSGQTILVRPWGFDQIMANSAILGAIIADVLEALEPPEEDAEDSPDTQTVITEILQRNFARLRDLMVASFENGEDDLQKLAGFGDLVTTLETIVEINQIVEAVGKIQGRLDALPKIQTPPSSGTKKTTKTAPKKANPKST